MFSVNFGGKVFSTNDYDKIRSLLEKATILVGHNIIRFDIPVLERLLKIKIKAKLVDTLALSWYLYPERKKHGLEEWGEEFGVPKPKINDWFGLSYEEYEHRCSEDVKINTRLWEKQWALLRRIYGSDVASWRLIDYLMFKMQCARKQEESGWSLDIPFTENALISLLEQQKEKIEALKKVMPKVPIYNKKTRPKRPVNKDGTPSKIGQSWLDLLAEQNLPDDTEEVEVLTGYEEPNPASHDQIKSWLFELGWVPETFKTVKNKQTGETRQIPQVNKEAQKGGGICESIKKLYDKEPNLELLDGLSVLNHRISLLSGFLRDVEDGKLKARVSGFTNTLRFKHAEIVNLPKVNRPFGEFVRGALIAPEGYELCGADKSSLEDRLKQHFIYPLDPDYVNEMNTPDFDPHLDIAVLGRGVTKEQADAYKKGDDSFDLKAIKKKRDIFKNGNYACQYGAGPPRLAITCGISLPEARALHETYWQRNWAIKEVAEQQVVKTVDDQMWLFNPVSHFWYSLRFEKDRFSTLIQGTASYCFDLWVGFILEERDQITAQFHDEIVLTIRKGFREQANDLCHRALERTNEKLKLNRRLDIGVQFGARYSEIH